MVTPTDSIIRNRKKVAQLTAKCIGSIFKIDANKIKILTNFTIKN